jgi:hypothetical protein
MINRIATMALFACTFLTAQRKLLPVDESAADPEFSKFYQSFRTAVAQKDAKFLIGILDPEVQSEIDGDQGPDAFEKRWKPDSPDSKLWAELAAVAALGGSFSKEQGTKTFCAPYIYSKFPDAIDSFEHGVILRANVQLRSKPSEHASVIARLSHDIVKVPDWKPAPDDSHIDVQWLRVIARAGSGYVRTSDIRSPTDFRACFHRKDGTWLLRWLIAGD